MSRASCLKVIGTVSIRFTNSPIAKSDQANLRWARRNSWLSIWGEVMSLVNRVRPQRRLHVIGKFIAASIIAGVLISASSFMSMAVERSPLEASAYSGDPDAQFKLGNAYLNGDGRAKDINKFLFWLTSAGSKHHGPAQLSIGIAYFYGWGVAVDPLSAKYWLIRAAQSGMQDAQYYLQMKELSLASPMADYAAEQHTANKPTHDVFLSIYGKISPAK